LRVRQLSVLTIYYNNGRERVTNKQEALNVISKLPDSADFEDIMYRLYVLEQIQRGREDVDDGKTTSIEDLKLEASNW